MINNETKEIINIACNILTSIGTVGAVIFALWPKKPKPKLSIYATDNIEHSIVGDKKICRKFFVIQCINKNNQPIHVTHFSFYSNKFKNYRLDFFSNLEIKAYAINQPPFT